MSWKPEVSVRGKWLRNDLVFATREEAKANANDLFARWTLTDDFRAAESSDPVNATYDLTTRKLIMKAGGS